jgi:hypothetical protein
MAALANNIRRAVREGRYLFERHANERLRRRQIMGWQLLGEPDEAKLLCERPDATPNPVVEFAQTLADGSSIKAVGSWIATERIAKLATVHFIRGK